MQNVKMHKLSSAKASFVAHELIYGEIISQLHSISLFNCNKSCKTYTLCQRGCDNHDKANDHSEMTKIQII